MISRQIAAYRRGASGSPKGYRSTELQTVTEHHQTAWQEEPHRLPRVAGFIIIIFVTTAGEQFVLAAALSVLGPPSPVSVLPSSLVKASPPAWTSPVQDAGQVCKVLEPGC
ncbi:hypothetical protein CTA1_11254 [Colletotrichum tanaceti]|uniref:Uncharacterized protein n=1 Tax=Colletotrichum tanaceti TaxID=1306861 RepID=A0A4U6XC45_9PEZI|nr:hypothetical protein CTA1_11254 [Colletotrichum tanaceti]